MADLESDKKAIAAKLDELGVAANADLKARINQYLNQLATGLNGKVMGINVLNPEDKITVSSKTYSSQLGQQINKALTFVDGYYSDDTLRGAKYNQAAIDLINSPADRKALFDSLDRVYPQLGAQTSTVKAPARTGKPAPVADPGYTMVPKLEYSKDPRQHPLQDNLSWFPADKGKSVATVASMRRRIYEANADVVVVPTTEIQSAVGTAGNIIGTAGEYIGSVWMKEAGKGIAGAAGGEIRLGDPSLTDDDREKWLRGELGTPRLDPAAVKFGNPALQGKAAEFVKHYRTYVAGGGKDVQLVSSPNKVFEKVRNAPTNTGAGPVAGAPDAPVAGAPTGGQPVAPTGTAPVAGTSGADLLKELSDKEASYGKMTEDAKKTALSDAVDQAQAILPALTAQLKGKIGAAAEAKMGPLASFLFAEKEFSKFDAKKVDVFQKEGNKGFQEALQQTMDAVNRAAKTQGIDLGYNGVYTAEVGRKVLENAPKLLEKLYPGDDKKADRETAMKTLPDFIHSLNLMKTAGLIADAPTGNGTAFGLSEFGQSILVVLIDILRGFLGMLPLSEKTLASIDDTIGKMSEKLTGVNLISEAKRLGKYDTSKSVEELTGSLKGNIAKFFGGLETERLKDPKYKGMTPEQFQAEIRKDLVSVVGLSLKETNGAELTDAQKKIVEDSVDQSLKGLVFDKDGKLSADCVDEVVNEVVEKVKPAIVAPPPGTERPPRGPSVGRDDDNVSEEISGDPNGGGRGLPSGKPTVLLTSKEINGSRDIHIANFAEKNKLRYTPKADLIGTPDKPEAIMVRYRDSAGQTREVDATAQLVEYSRTRRLPVGPPLGNLIEQYKDERIPQRMLDDVQKEINKTIGHQTMQQKMSFGAFIGNVAKNATCVEVRDDDYVLKNGYKSPGCKKEFNTASGSGLEDVLNKLAGRLPKVTATVTPGKTASAPAEDDPCTEEESAMAPTEVAPVAAEEPCDTETEIEQNITDITEVVSSFVPAGRPLVASPRLGQPRV